jgi:cytochrome c oxidase subunit 4
MSKIVIDKPGDYALAHKVVPVSTYLIIFTCLIILTATTVFVAFHHLGDPWNDVVAIGIALTKASLVVLFFMHAKYSPAMIRLCVISAILFLLTLFFVTWSDYWARDKPSVRVQEIDYSVHQ